MLKNNVCHWQTQKINDKKVIGFQRGGVFYPSLYWNLFLNVTKCFFFPEKINTFE